MSDAEEIFSKYGNKVKRVKKDKVKWLFPPEWSEKTVDALWITTDSKEIAEEIFRNYKVKVIKK